MVCLIQVSLLNQEPFMPQCPRLENGLNRSKLQVAMKIKLNGKRMAQFPPPPRKGHNSSPLFLSI